MEFEMNGVGKTALPKKRRVGVGLGLGIFFFPVLFGWVVLRKGHSNLARIVVLPWLVLGVMSTAFTGYGIKMAFDKNKESSAVTAQANAKKALSESL